MELNYVTIKGKDDIFFRNVPFMFLAVSTAKPTVGIVVSLYPATYRIHGSYTLFHNLQKGIASYHIH